jgi:phosphopentomutase
MTGTTPSFDRVIILVLDALGIGALPDVHLIRPNDVGSNTLKHVVSAVGGLSLPNLERLGLGTVAPSSGLRIDPAPISVHGMCNLGYKGADTYLGHQVIMGSRVPDVPEELFEAVSADVAAALRQAGHHVEPAGEGLSALFVDGKMICGDNLESDPLQTYHCVGSIEDTPYEDIVKVGEILRSVARVRRVVAMGGYGFHAADIRRCTERRPTGQCGVNNVALGLYTSNYVVRHLTRGTKPDVQVPTILKKAGYEVELLGKVADVITCDGAHKEPHVLTQPVLDATYASMARVRSGLIAINIQETDLAGHDESAERYAACLRLADEGIGKMMSMMGSRDLLIVTGDHGNDPTIGHDKHTREFTPLLVWTPGIKPKGIFMRDSLSDIAATTAEIFSVAKTEIGTSFLDDIAVD